MDLTSYLYVMLLGCFICCTMSILYCMYVCTSSWVYIVPLSSFLGLFVGYLVVWIYNYGSSNPTIRDVLP